MKLFRNFDKKMWNLQYYFTDSYFQIISNLLDMREKPKQMQMLPKETCRKIKGDIQKPEENKKNALRFKEQIQKVNWFKVDLYKAN